MRFIRFHRPFGTGALLRFAAAAAVFGVLLSLGGPWEGTQASAAEGPAPEACQRSQSGAPTEEPAASLEVVLKHYQDLSRAHRDAILASGYADVRPVSTALEEAVRVAFEVAGSFEGARQLMGNAVVWCEPPTSFDWRAKEGPGYVSGLSDETLGETALEEPARIFYARYPAQGDVEAVVLMNSLVTREIGTQYLWLQTSPYALVRVGNAVRYRPFGDKMYDSPTCHIVPMGVVLNGASAPTALFLYRYSTRAGKVEIVMHALTPATSEWAEETLEWTSVTNFAYDAAIKQLTLWKWKGDGKEVVVSEVVDVVAQIEKWGPQRTWKLDAPKPDAISASPASNEVAAKAPTADGTPEALRQAITNYEAAVREEREHFKDGGPGYRWTAKTDLALKELVRVAFGQFGELEAVKTALGDRVRWQPVPRVVWGYNPTTYGGLMHGRLPKSALDEPPTIHFMTYESKEQGAVITVMLNTFATRDPPSVVPLDTYPYAAGRVNDRPFFSSDIAGISKITPEPLPVETHQLAGFVEAPGSLPAAVYFTQARGATFCAYVLNPADMTWSGGCYDEGWATDLWTYDCELHLVGLGDRSFDVGQWVRKWVLEKEN